MTDKYGKIHTDGSRSGGQPLDNSIEAKALALVNGVKTERGRNSYSHYTRLNRALDDGHEAFRREVSDAVEVVVEVFKHEVEVVVEVFKHEVEFPALERFIIPKPKPDPLVEVINDADDMVRKPDAPSYAEAIRAALKARGLEIREKSDD